MDVHARIHAFLQQQSVTPLTACAEPRRLFTKAGLVPFVGVGAARRFLVMKPVPRHAHLAPPAFQLCKGTRMQLLPGGWQDLRDGGEAPEASEALEVTALREGMEELGVTPDGIEALYDGGPCAFASSRGGGMRSMWLFAARLRTEEALLPMSAVAASTHARRWMTLAEFSAEGRADHRPILAALAALLAPES